MTKNNVEPPGVFALRVLKTVLSSALHFLLVIWLTISLIFAALVLIGGNPVSLFLDARLSPESRQTLKKVYGYHYK